MTLRSLLVCAFAAVLPAVAAAQQARALNAVALRAGPDRDYPFVASYVAGTPLAVQGCTDGYGWCDVIGPNGYRGWVYAGDLVYPYQRREVPVVSYGPVIGIPIVTFALGSYWATHYHQRPWYRDRDRWERHRPVYRPPGRPVQPIVRPDRPHHDRPDQGTRPNRGGTVIYDNGKPAVIVRPPTRNPNAPAPERVPQ